MASLVEKVILFCEEVTGERRWERRTAGTADIADLISQTKSTIKVSTADLYPFIWEDRRVTESLAEFVEDGGIVKIALHKDDASNPTEATNLVIKENPGLAKIWEDSIRRGNNRFELYWLSVPPDHPFTVFDSRCIAVEKPGYGVSEEQKYLRILKEGLLFDVSTKRLIADFDRHFDKVLMPFARPLTPPKQP